METLDHQQDTRPLPKTAYVSESFPRLATVLIVGIMASTLPQTHALGRLPFSNILKNHLHRSASDTASFFFYVGLFWYIKPIAGILTDAFPLFGTRRRYYILISSVLAAGGWIIVGLVPRTYNALLLSSIFMNLPMVMISTVTGAFLVEIGQSRHAVGKITAVRQVTFNACMLLQGPVGGILATLPFLLATSVNAAVVFSIFPIAWIFMQEIPTAGAKPESLQAAGNQLRAIIHSGTFWMALSFIALFYFAPGFSTLLYYRQNDVLKLPQKTIGYLGSLSGLGGVLAAIAYGFLAKRASLRALLAFGITTCAVGTLLYVFYSSLGRAITIDFQNGLFFGFAEVALIDLAARATPAGSEGLGYSLILSVRNLSLFGADKLGAWLSDFHHIAWNKLVFLNAGTTAIVLIILPFMPARIMRSRDSA